MDSAKNPENKRKIPGLYWLLLAICALATVALLGYLAFFFFAEGEGETPQEESSGTYSQEDLMEYWQDFDAMLLAALVNSADTKADQATLAQGTGANYFSVSTEGQILHFDLENYTLTIPQEQEGYDRLFAYTWELYSDVLFPQEPAMGYGQHLKAMGCNIIAEIRKDADGDARTEYLYVVENFGECWDASRLPEHLKGKTLCIYLDAWENSLFVHSFSGDFSQTEDMVWDGGILHLVQGNGKVQRLLLTESQLCLPDYSENTDALRQITRRYARILEDKGHTRVRMILADVSGAPGQEILCTYQTGQDYVLEVLSLREGKLDLLDRFSSEQGAVYQLENSLVSYGDGAYRRFRYDEENRLVVEEEADDILLSHSYRIAQLQEEGRVCFDFCQSGEALLMEGSIDEDLGLAPASRLRITGTTTGKLGIVTLKNADSTLNLRTGPSTDHDLLWTEARDHVKLPNGGVVTVVMPYNTDSTNHPIWVKVRFDYEGKIMEGFASQRYIRLEEATALKPGQQLQLGVEGDDPTLRWESSDPSVAKVDPQTGLVTGMKTGLVLITVTNETGVQDSCLIRVN